MPADPGFADVPSNFTVNDYLDFNSGFDESCLVGQGEGKLRFLCIESHVGYNDPIVYPGQEGAAHLHQFFGNTSVDHNSNWNSLRTTGNGTCQGGPLNRTGYWFPAMIRPQNNKVVKPAYIELYYVSQAAAHVHDDFVSSNPAYPHTNFGTRTFPNGLYFIWGWKESDGNTPYAGGSIWRRGTQPGTFGTLPALAAGTVDQTDSQGRHSNIIARTGSPTCWNGVLQPPDGRSHLTHTFQDGFGKPICPATHPYRLPSIELIIVWSHNGEADFSQWYIASDQGHGAPAATYVGATTFHADWFGAWDPGIQDIWSTQHLAIGGDRLNMKTSSGGILCQDDASLDWAQRPTNHGRVQVPEFQNDTYLPEALRYVDIPPVPGTGGPDPTPPPLATIASLTLVNADTGADIGPLGTTIDLAALPTKNLNVRANTSPAVVTSVSFDLDGVVTTETGAPYAMKGDVSGVYNKWTPSVGAHVLNVTPTNAGVVGTQTIANFTVSDTVVPPIPPEPPVVVYRWQAYKTGKSTLYRFYENNVEVIDALSLTEARWLSGVLKIAPP